MKNLVYLSTAVQLLNDKELLQILTAARENNKKHNVTGVLLYSEGTFIQVLEGDDAAVDQIYGCITKDGRHKNPIVLMDTTTTKRNFPDWSMGFSSVNLAISAAMIESFTSTDRLLSTPGDDISLVMIKSFIESNNLVVQS